MNGIRPATYFDGPFGWLVFVALSAVSALALLGCSGRDGEATVNVGVAMNLDLASRLRIDVANPERASGWQTLGYSFDAAALKALRDGLTVNLPLRPRLRCPEQYRVVAGTDEWGFTLGYLCADGNRILRGSDALWDGKDILAPERVAAALDAVIAQVKAHPTTSANPFVSARLAEAGRLVVRRKVPSGSYPLVVEVTDPAVLASFVATLNVDRPLVPRDGCEGEYLLTFILGRTAGAVSFAPPPGPIFDYRCADGRDLLSGSQVYWVGDAIEAPQGFRERFDGLIAGKP